MNKIGLHMGYWRGTGRDGDVFGMLDLAFQTGVDVFETTPASLLPLSKEERVKFKDTVAGYGMTLSVNGGLTPQYDIAADDPAVRKAGVAFCKDVLKMTAELGSDRWSGPNYSAWLRRPDKTLDAAEKTRIRDLSIASLKEILKVAEDLNIIYCFEVLNRFEQFLINTSAEGVAYCEDTGSPNAKVLLDTYHMNIEEDSITDAILYAGSKGRLGHFHVGESNRRVPGSGPSHIAWKDIFAALEQTGYTGYITMEPFVKMGYPGALNTCVWRDLSNGATVPEMIAVAKKGAAFIRSFLKK
ncbi:MAG: sugar phosphate isomerase/epimerase family protein [Christensenellales bacterium]